MHKKQAVGPNPVDIDRGLSINRVVDKNPISHVLNLGGNDGGE